MAASALSIVTPKPETIKPFNPRPFIVCRSSTSSSSPSSILTSSQNSTAPNKKRPLFEVGIGLLAASLLVSSPLNANATRLNYYATVAEPPCEFKFAPSGLGYCDLAVGSGKEAPYDELINVSSLMILICSCFFWVEFC